MTEFFSLLLSFVALWLLFLLPARAACWFFLRRLDSRHPRQSADFLLCVLLAPVVLSFIATVIITLNTIVPTLPGHCHAGECGAHLPYIQQATTIGWVLLVIAGAALLGVWWKILRPAHRLLQQLSATGEGGQGSDPVVLPDDRPLAFTLGLLHPRVFISRGLLERCSQSSLAVLLAHEAAHYRYRDNLRLLLARLTVAPLAFCFHAPLEKLSLLHEMACDADASCATSRESAAQAIIEVTRLQKNWLSVNLPPTALAFNGSNVEQRVKFLLAAKPARYSYQPVIFFIVAVLAALLLAQNNLHQLVELL